MCFLYAACYNLRYMLCSVVACVFVRRRPSACRRRRRARRGSAGRSWRAPTWPGLEQVKTQRINNIVQVIRMNELYEQ